VAALLVLGGVSVFLLIFAVASAVTGAVVSAIAMLAVIALIWWLWARFG